LEISELQRALSEAQTYLFEERKQLLKSLAENDELRLQELKDRKKIRYLLSLYGLPDQEETTYFKEQLERRFIKRSTQNAEFQMVDEDPLDEEDPETLRLRCKALKAQLDEQARIYDETIAAMKQDQELIRQEKQAARKQDKERIEELISKMQKLQEFCRENTRELLEVKKAHRISERRSKEERARLIEDLSQTRFTLGEERGRLGTIERAIEGRVSRRNEELIGELRQQVGKYEGMIEEFRGKQRRSEQDYQRQVEALKERLTLSDKSLKQVQKRRQTEIQGLHADMEMLKKQLRTMEKQVSKVGPIEDRELEYLGIAKETGNRAAKLSNAIHSIKSRLYETERELRALPI
jgi:hypothetical protein